MGKIKVTGGNQPPVHINWKAGVKTVTTDNGSRVDKYSGGAGKPDGPGHSHSWATFNKAGKQTSDGSR